MSDNFVFVIPARGGSKGIPKKNIKDFCGKPLIAWTIEEALKTHLGKVLVSSDSNEILSVAKKYGAIGVKRPVELATDTSSSEDAIKNALITHFGKKKMPETTIFLQCTSPWITSDDIINASFKYKESMVSSLAFVKKTHQYTHKIINDYYIEPLMPERAMRQGMNQYLTEVGAYIFDTKEFLITTDRFCKKQKTGYYIINRELPPEIDSPTDFEINELFFCYWKNNKSKHL